MVQHCFVESSGRNRPSRGVNMLCCSVSTASDREHEANTVQSGLKPPLSCSPPLQLLSCRFRSCKGGDARPWSDNVPGIRREAESSYLVPARGGRQSLHLEHAVARSALADALVPAGVYQNSQT
eukprot:348190-Hanusia_phi.AAC.1